MKEKLTHPVFKTISEIVSATGQEAYVIGGYVRDIYLNRPSKDIDVVVIGSGIELAEAVAKKLGNIKLSVFKIMRTNLRLLF